MGFIKAFAGAISGTFADQWLDFYQPKAGAPATAGVIPAVTKSVNNGRGANTNGSENIITNGSKIIVPENYALITIQDGAITGCVTEPGGFTFSSDDPNSKSFLNGDGILASTIGESFERFKFGGQPSSQQLAFYVNLKEIPNNKFGTQSELYWDDAFMNTQVGALVRGKYTIKIVDPILFLKNFVPAKYLEVNAKIFDFADIDNDACEQLFSNVVSSLGKAFSKYTQGGNRIGAIQGDQIGFAKTLSETVEEQFQWKSHRGLEITETTIDSIEYDDDTKELLKQVKKTDALSGARGNAYMQQSVAESIKAMGENGGGGTGLAFMGVGMNAAAGMASGLQQPVTNNPSGYAFGANAAAPATPATPEEAAPVAAAATETTAAVSEDPTDRLIKMKKLLDAGAITQEDFDKVKNQILGL